jgi:DNA gyrase subunit A
MSRQDVRDAILELARDGEEDQLLEMSIMSTQPDLYEDAVIAFGGWDAALVSVLVELVESKGTSRRRSSTTEETVDRQPDRDAEQPIFVTTTAGKVYTRPGNSLEISDAVQGVETPEAAGKVLTLQNLGDPGGVIVFTDRGRYFGIDGRMVPTFQEGAPYRDIAKILDLEAGEKVRNLLTRDDLRSGRIIHVTRGAKGKATDTEEFGYVLDREGREAFLLNDGDEPVAVLSGHEDAHVFCASANGLGILFESTELRSMGRRAVGVNVMKLADDQDEVVGAFLPDDTENVAVITRQGLAKRVRFDEFRPQGRAGAGMQLAKLNDDDTVAAIAPCGPSQDLAVVTNSGKVRRMPAHLFPLMGRPAKGDRLFELGDSEWVVGVHTLPCSTT